MPLKGPGLSAMYAAAFVVCACSGTPTQPAPTSTSPATQPQAIQLVSSTPGPNGVVVTPLNAQPPASIDAASLGFTFTVRPPAALTSAQMQVDLVDARAIVCGQLFTSPQDLPAGHGTTVSTQGTPFNWTCAVPVKIVAVNTAVYTASAGTKTTYIGQSFDAPFTVQPMGAPNASFSSGIELINAFPAAGGTVVTGTGENLHPPSFFSGLTLTFGVVPSVSIPGAQLEVDLFDASGVRCGGLFSNNSDVVAGVPTTITVSQVGWSCPVPVTTVTMTATLLNIVLLPGASRTTRTDYATQSFPVGFSFTPFPPPPAGAPPTGPNISKLDWQNLVTACGGPKCGLVFDDFPQVLCAAYEVDGAPMTVTIDWTWDTGKTTTGTVTFPAGASSLSRTIGGRLVRGAEAIVGSAVPAFPNGVAPRATAVCTVTNDRGESVTKTIQIPGGG